MTTFITVVRSVQVKSSFILIGSDTTILSIKSYGRPGNIFRPHGSERNEIHVVNDYVTFCSEKWLPFCVRDRKTLNLTLRHFEDKTRYLKYYNRYFVILDRNVGETLTLQFFIQ